MRKLSFPGFSPPTAIARAPTEPIIIRKPQLETPYSVSGSSDAWRSREELLEELAELRARVSGEWGSDNPNDYLSGIITSTLPEYTANQNGDIFDYSRSGLWGVNNRSLSGNGTSTLTRNRQGYPPVGVISGLTPYFSNSDYAPRRIATARRAMQIQEDLMAYHGLLHPVSGVGAWRN